MNEIPPLPSQARQRHLADRLEAWCGIRVAEARLESLTSDLLALSAASGCESPEELLARATREPAAERRLLDLVTAAERSFLGDDELTSLLEGGVLPELLAAAQARPDPTIRVWCPASRGGLEPYSLVILLLEMERHGSLRPGGAVAFKILASEISETLLARARETRFSAGALARDLAPELIERHFEPCGDALRPQEPLRRLVAFRRQNVLDAFAGIGPFDLILCREVLVYFQPAIKHDVLERFADLLREGGLLLAGPREDLARHCKRFEAEPTPSATCYRLRR